MPNYAGTMTVRQMVDVVAFLAVEIRCPADATVLRNAPILRLDGPRPILITSCCAVQACAAPPGHASALTWPFGFCRPSRFGQPSGAVLCPYPIPL